MYYISVYNNLCSSRSQLKTSWTKKSGLHRHHIVPVHMGGIEHENNFTYLTVREHIIAHYLLWKIYNTPNDLRAMKMLGAKLTYHQRKIIGVWCRDNKIGFHGASAKEKAEWQHKGRESQKKSDDKNSWYFWSTIEGRKKRASLGGKASIKSGNNKLFVYWASEEGRKKRASLGGKSHKGKIAMTNGTHRTRIKPELVDEYLNKGYRKGFTLSSDI